MPHFGQVGQINALPTSGRDSSATSILIPLVPVKHEEQDVREIATLTVPRLRKHRGKLVVRTLPAPHVDRCELRVGFERVGQPGIPYSKVVWGGQPTTPDASVR